LQQAPTLSEITRDPSVLIAEVGTALKADEAIDHAVKVEEVAQ
jgi:hypothetical protein